MASPQFASLALFVLCPGMPPRTPGRDAMSASSAVNTSNRLSRLMRLAMTDRSRIGPEQPSTDHNVAFMLPFVSGLNYFVNPSLRRVAPGSASSNCRSMAFS